MARIRTIKPEFFTSEDIVELSAMARLLYIALWCESDKEGRLAWKPKTFKMRYFPADDCNIESMCREIISKGLVVLYSDGLAFIPAFKEHQHINPRESESKLPEPDASTTRQPRVGTGANPDDYAQVGREGKGKEGVTPDGDDGASLFAQFWTSYPNKTGKGAAEKAWAKIKRPSETLKLILVALERQRQSPQWTKDNGQFIPNPATWLNQRRWEDGEAEQAMTPEQRQAEFMRKHAGIES